MANIGVDAHAFSLVIANTGIRARFAAIPCYPIIILAYVSTRMGTIRYKRVICGSGVICRSRVVCGGRVIYGSWFILGIVARFIFRSFFFLGLWSFAFFFRLRSFTFFFHLRASIIAGTAICGTKTACIYRYYIRLLARTSRSRLTSASSIRVANASLRRTNQITSF
jgi:hypothetical protein